MYDRQRSRTKWVFSRSCSACSPFQFSVHSSQHIPLLCSRVLAFFDMDGNFSLRRPLKRPADAGDRLKKKALPVKPEETTDLDHQNPNTTSLKNFGDKQPPEKERDLQVEITRDGNPLTLDRKYQDWIIQMPERYDEEVNCSVDDPIIIVGSSNTNELPISRNDRNTKRNLSQITVLTTFLF